MQSPVNKRWSWRSSVSCALVALSGGLVQAADPASEWLADANSGVRIWNPVSVPGETVRWEGARQDDKASGPGVAVWYAEGEEREQAAGEWGGGRLNGHAVWWHRDGMRYEGCWENGRRHGAGVYAWPDGTRFCGWYHDGVRREGAFFRADGSPAGGLPPGSIRKLVLDAENAALKARRSATKARRQEIR